MDGAGRNASSAVRSMGTQRLRLIEMTIKAFSARMKEAPMLAIEVWLSLAKTLHFSYHGLPN